MAEREGGGRRGREVGVGGEGEGEGEEEVAEVSATSSAAAAMELSDLGVTTVDTKKHEKKIIEEKIRTLNKEEEERGSGNARVNAGDTDDTGAQLAGVQREIQTVREIIEDMDQNNAEGEKKSELGNPLRTTLMARLKSLRKEKKRLFALQQGDKGGRKRLKKKVSFSNNALDNAIRSSSRLMETERDKLIRTGVLTPFDKMKGFERKQKSSSDLIDDKVNQALLTAKENRSLRSASKSGALTLDASQLPPRRGSSRSERNRFNWRGKRKRIASSTSLLKGMKSKIRMADRLEFAGEISDEESESEYDFEGEEAEDDVIFDGGYRLSGEMWEKLFDYQKTGVKWMWELHSQGSGGILGDEMGLGKTVQVISFLEGLLRSGMYNTSIIVCPVTLMSHWTREFQRWAPMFKVFILHDSACKSKVGQSKELMYVKVINSAMKSDRGVLVTSYEQLRLRQEFLLGYQWGYAILDEGHKIRNPNIELTLVCKQLSTPHRIILTGAPIQNRLVEIWSLFDFVFPGKLGTLPVFSSQFSVPIQMGGYAHASKLQITTAYKCALILRDLINPYLLRRKKTDVNINLPKKSEHVLFCLLGDEQLGLYRDYLASHDCTAIMDGKLDALAGIDVMKKICNHPDLLDIENDYMADYGNQSRSGKLAVLMKVLHKWSSEGHKVLVFSQTRQMLDIIEKSVKGMDLRYLRMDGTTQIQKRQSLVDMFNETEEIKVFCLTTRVGGLGLNLTGADRVILYDPDWNPSTDLQAQERSWRIGQQNDVIVYRLVTSGTIEEKIYNRQIFKQFVANKVLQDPKQRRAFQNEDIRELFVLGEEYTSGNNNLRDITNIETQLMPDEILDDASQPGPGANIDNESSMLKSLMEGEVVSKALCHEKIMTATSSTAPSYDKKASEIAEKAATMIKNSQRDCSRHDVSVPTWTGRSGSAGAPRRFGGVKRFGQQGPPGGVMTSKQLVEKIRSREADVQEFVEPEVKLMKDVIDFLAKRKGTAATGDIVRYFSFVGQSKSQ